MNSKNILLLSLVHPDFLPPVYAVAQSLRDLNYNIHILTFDSLVPSEYDLGDNITLQTVGRHYDASVLGKIKLRSEFKKIAGKFVQNNNITAIISFCPFTLICGLKIKKNFPVMYIALEVADFVFSKFFKSPLTNYRNMWALNNLHHADLVATPSVQRSAWLAGRCHLSFLPYTILNTAYITDKIDENINEIYKNIIPKNFDNKTILLYTGAVNKQHGILEVVEAFDIIDDADSALIITGIKDNPYSMDVKTMVTKMKSGNRVFLSPYVTRKQMEALQTNADIGVCIEKEEATTISSKLMAPNKAGEYLSKKLHILGVKTEYLKQFEVQGIATLAVNTSVQAITIAMREALTIVRERDNKQTIIHHAKEYFCMQKQIVPIVNLLNKFQKKNKITEK